MASAETPEEKEPAAPAAAGTEPAVPEAPPSAIPRRTQSFRRELIKKLPQLSHAGFSVKENFKIDEEWAAVVNLRADPLLEALEKIAPERLRSK